MDRLTGQIQPYAWGSKTAIPELLGSEPTDDPQAELWLGAHPKAPSTFGDQPLDAAITADPESLVGKASVDQFGARLPYLMKVLAAAQPLSLQAHPSRDEAEAGFAREEAAGIAVDAAERLYKDDWPKPEALCALGDVEALCGFRDPAETHALFTALGVESAAELVAPLQQGEADSLAEVFGNLLQLSEDQALIVTDVVEAARALVDGDDDLAAFARTAVELDQFYPGDAGVLGGLLMNRMAFGRNQALFLPAGNLHAYLHGIGVEIMANSDNVLRGGLTPKHIDVEELLRLLDFTPGVPDLVEAVEEEPGVWRYQTPAPEFALWRLDLDDQEVALPGTGHGRIALVVEGSARLSGPATLELGRGESAFVTAPDDVRAKGTGTVFVGGPGVG